LRRVMPLAAMAVPVTRPALQQQSEINSPVNTDSVYP